jgi:hypothetical protein
MTGEGIALGRRSVTRSDILAGTLVRLSEHSLRVPTAQCGLSDLFGVQPGLGGSPGLADRRGRSHLGSCGAASGAKRSFAG